MSKRARRPEGEGIEQLVPGSRTLPRAARAKPRQPAAAAVAAALASALPKTGVSVHLASSDRRAEEIARALAGMTPDIEVLVLPPWDCLPFDRASPGRDVMGRRMSVLRRLADAKAKRRVLILSPESLLQRTPPRAAIATTFGVHTGEPLDRPALEAFASRSGYVQDDRIDEPGEIALFGEVIDVFPADAAMPVRIVVGQDDAVSEIRTYDPITQRSDETIDALVLGPASELILDEPQSRSPGQEHRLPEAYDRTLTLFDLIPKAVVTRDTLFEARLNEALEQIDDAHEAQRLLNPSGEISAGASLYLTSDAVRQGLATWKSMSLALQTISPAPSTAGARNPGRAFCDAVAAESAAGRRVVLAGLAAERRALRRALKRGLDLTPSALDSWQDVEALPAKAVSEIDLDIDTGFVDAARDLVVVGAADVLGDRLAVREGGADPILGADPDLRLGDVVLHEDHGIGVLRELQIVEIDGVVVDTLRLEYHGGSSVLAPIGEMGRMWRYGAEEEAVTLDRLNGDAWPKRRAAVSRHLDEVADRLVALAQAREAATCRPIEPPPAYARFAAKFGYPETKDQTAAIAAVLDDLASGRPMDRLVCGDVGFGKTEVALRAAAVVALSGRQVAVCAPTTVLAKQHFQLFQRRFAGTAVKVEQLSRLVAAREAKEVREAVGAGEVGILVGTHALASDSVAFADLGLMIVDEEQKFGAAVKQRLRDLARNGHHLAMTATPIPRTLQAAMIGIQDVSIIASPPARRRPIRTFLAPFDPASVRTALLREARRSGQSFVVAPRIEDLQPLAEQLRAIVPELTVRIAHGGLPADEVDEVMVGFAAGEGDILLATNIIESGLDVPRANTMIVWQPDRFGLAQLHQLRGRVGRGRAQGIAYLLHDPETPLSDATRARLSTLEAFDRLGSGLAISARDLDLRGGGDLIGEDQAGHMAMIGATLYQRLLAAAVRGARGEADQPRPPAALQMLEQAYIPVDHVPDAITRINLYARMAKLETPEDVDSFGDELEDRFGVFPPPLAALIQQVRIARVAGQVGVSTVASGPKGLALSFGAAPAAPWARLLERLPDGAHVTGERLIIPTPDASSRSAILDTVLRVLRDV